MSLGGHNGIQQPARVARKFRVEYPGVIYHVMNLGDRREPIFKDDFDRRRLTDHRLP